MGVLRKLRTLLRAALQPPAPSAADEAAADALRARFRERCAHFRRLLSANKAVLETMADVEQRLRGPQPFGMPYVRGVVTRAGAGVFQMIRSVNALSGDAYGALDESFARIASDMEAAMALPVPAGDGPLVLPLAAVDLAHLSLVGGKMANLGEIRRHVGMPVPDGFAVTVHAHDRFMAHNGLQEEIDSRIRAAGPENLEALFALSSSIQQIIHSAPLPDDVARAVAGQVEAMQARAGKERDRLRLALRSSAVGEDALGASFAGQYRTELNVHPDEVLDVWREIIAGKYSVTALSYRYQRGIPDVLAPMCVGVLAMVDARAGGVAYSRDPVRPDAPVIVVNAVPGLPVAVVDGSFSPDTLSLSRERPPRILERHIRPGKPFRCVCDPDHGVRRDPLSPEEADAPAVDEAMAIQLGSLVLALEEYYDEAQDVEWAVDRQGRIVILQSRPLRKRGHASPEEQRAPADAKPPGPVLLHGGTAVSPGIGAGAAVIVRKEADMLSFPVGGVLVVERAGPRWATLLSRAAAVVAEEGGMAGHLASVAREYGVPAIFGIRGALQTLSGTPPPEVTVDAVRGCVYAGLHSDMPGALPRRDLMEGSPVHNILSAVSRFMTPLNLLDPTVPEFAPERCRTLHDITRFCHEKAVRLMFGDEENIDARGGKQLKAGVKLQYWVIDLEDGFIEPVRGPMVELSNIRSAPMLALWRGMTAAPWTGPPDADAHGFLSVVAESAMNRQLEAAAATEMGNKNFLMISSTFMNLQARFGYHFCTVETQAGPNAHENYVSFQFKGGAASLDRRVARAVMVGDLLEGCGFRVDVKEDALFAVAESRDARESLAHTAVLGYLVVHTRQIDMIMHNKPYVAALREKFLRDIAPLATT